LKGRIILLASAGAAFVIVITLAFLLVKPEFPKPVSHKLPTPALNLSNSTKESVSPAILASDSNVYVAWVEAGWNSSDVYFRKSSDNGMNFDKPIILSASYGAPINGLEISQDGSNLYLTWYQGLGGRGASIHLASSYDHGNTFLRTAVKNVSNEILWPMKLASANDSVYIMWAEANTTSGEESSAYSIFLARSVDKGNSIAEIKPLQTNAGPSEFRDIVAKGNNVYVLWHSTGPNREHRIFFEKSSDNGKTFGEALRLDRNKSLQLHYATNGNLALSGNFVYAIWNLGSESTNLAQYVISSDSGNTFGSPITIDPTQRIFYPSISALANDVYILWETGTPNGDPAESDVYFIHSTDNGRTFTEASNLSNDTLNNSYPVMSVAESRIAIVWLGWENNITRGGWDGTTDTYLTSSSDGGFTFSAPSKISSELDHRAISAGVAGSIQRFYIIWSDQDGQKKDIFLTVNDE